MTNNRLIHFENLDQSTIITWLPIRDLELPIFLTLTSLIFGEIFETIIKATSGRVDCMNASV